MIYKYYLDYFWIENKYIIVSYNRSNLYDYYSLLTFNRINSDVDFTDLNLKEEKDFNKFIEFFSEKEFDEFILSERRELKISLILDKL